MFPNSVGDSFAHLTRLLRPITEQPQLTCSSDNFVGVTVVTNTGHATTSIAIGCIMLCMRCCPIIHETQSASGGLYRWGHFRASPFAKSQTLAVRHCSRLSILTLSHTVMSRTSSVPLLLFPLRTVQCVTYFRFCECRHGLRIMD